MEKSMLSLIELAKMECDIHLEKFLSEDMLKDQMRDLDEKRKLLTSIKLLGGFWLYHLDKDMLQRIEMKEKV